MKKFFIVQLHNMIVTNRIAIQAVDMQSALALVENIYDPKEAWVVLAADVTVSQLNKSIQDLEKVNEPNPDFEHLKLVGIDITSECDAVAYVSNIHILGLIKAMRLDEVAVI